MQVWHNAGSNEPSAGSDAANWVTVAMATRTQFQAALWRQNSLHFTVPFFSWSASCQWHIRVLTPKGEGWGRGLNTFHEYIVSWAPEGCYHYSTMFHWKPEGRCCCTKSVAIAPSSSQRNVVKQRWIPSGSQVTIYASEKLSWVWV